MHSNLGRLTSMLVVASAITLVGASSSAQARHYTHYLASASANQWLMDGAMRSNDGFQSRVSYQRIVRHARRRSEVWQSSAEQNYSGWGGELADRQSAERPARRKVRVASLGNGVYGAGHSSGSDVVAEARRWIGSNPTGWAHVWCGRFMNFVLERTGRRGTGSNLALSFAHYGRRVSGPQIGAIAVMGRSGGGHVGVVSGIDPHGNPILISGNHGHQVAEAVYPRGRIFAYVMP
jgi:uncharacterized protein (TIGR02594 family)